MNDMPNRKKLGDALDIYRTQMRVFIPYALRQVTGRGSLEELIRNALTPEKKDFFDQCLKGNGGNAPNCINIGEFPTLVSKYWREAFEPRWGYDRRFQNLVYLIRSARNDHKQGNEMGAEYVRSSLTMIANALDMIGSKEAQSARDKVEAIRDNAHPPLFSEDAWQNAKDLWIKKPLTMNLDGDEWMDAQKKIKEIQVRAELHLLSEKASICQLCPLHETRTNVVFGEGNPNADLMFLGLAPGSSEDEAGKPFIGVAGELLSEIIKAMELRREDVYIADMVKCKPTKTPNLESKEMKRCRPYLHRQIELVQPRVIVLLGETVTRAVLESKQFSNLRGRFHDYPGNNAIKTMPTYHPAYLLRNPGSKRDVWEDMRKVMELLGLEQRDNEHG